MFPKTYSETTVGIVDGVFSSAVAETATAIDAPATAAVPLHPPQLLLLLQSLLWLRPFLAVLLLIYMVAYEVIRAKRVSNCYIQEKNICPSVCVDVRLILILVWKTLILVLVWGTYYVPATYVPGISRQTTVWYQVRTYNIGLHPTKKKKTPGTSERFVANCGVGPSTRGQGDSASLVKPTQDQRR